MFCLVKGRVILENAKNRPPFGHDCLHSGVSLLSPKSQVGLGLIFGVSAFTLWGLAPIYFSSIRQVPHLELLCHRVVWSFLFLAIYLKAAGHLSEVRWILRSPLIMGKLVITTILISINWFLFIYAVNSGQTLEASLGYFINPLIVIALGVIFLKERLSGGQIFSFLFALVAVAIQGFWLKEFPWLSLSLATSFAVYGLLKKTMPIHTVAGLFIETAWLTPLAIGYLVSLSLQGTSSFLSGHWQTSILLSCAGFMTAIPLMLFTGGAKRLHLSTMGFLQYISPSLHFILAVYVFNELLAPEKYLSFILLWAGLVILVGDSFLRRRGYALKTPSPPVL
jgi:chloramphenicol-sensitive protein RarD